MQESSTKFGTILRFRHEVERSCVSTFARLSR